MLPLKLVRSLVSGDDVTTNPLFLCNVEQESDDSDDPTSTTKKTPLMLFLPNQELVRDTYRLASIARALGMDLQPNPSLSHIIFSWPPPPQSSTPSSSSSSNSPHSWASASSPLSYSWSLPDGGVPLPFPSFATASLSHLRLFVGLSRGYFKLAFLKSGCAPLEKIESLSNNNWHCTSLSLFASGTGERVESMEGFSRVLLGKGWALFKTNCGGERELYLYRKSDASRIRGNGDLRECSRARELRLPALDFRNVPLRVLQYILLMTDDVFYLA
ncbi:hypothetical protein SASPL_142404 [Salvia splendens]|uniref:Uncharacterized protein n=1 Tax=Salvia splendens TaxID=180675 RepID=A0A8X8WLE7_SALSN|nr:uncharacterized protein LOC121772503 [Salvia splendens]KAG6396258.1 hypothetical protein SASPL_142404 [Salvia splendens]